MDFSVPEKIDEFELYFEKFQETVEAKFLSIDYLVFDFKYSRKPRKRNENTPDFWAGWAIEFKLIEKNKSGYPIEKMRREAIIPVGGSSSKVKIDLSEYEYCGSVEKIKIGSEVEISVYSRVLLVLEKLRAICQQHPNYPH